MSSRTFKKPCTILYCVERSFLCRTINAKGTTNHCDGWNRPSLGISLLLPWWEPWLRSMPQFSGFICHSLLLWGHEECWELKSTSPAQMYLKLRIVSLTFCRLSCLDITMHTSNSVCQNGFINFYLNVLLLMWAYHTPNPTRQHLDVISDFSLSLLLPQHKHEDFQLYLLSILPALHKVRHFIQHSNKTKTILQPEWNSRIVNVIMSFWFRLFRL